MEQPSTPARVARPWRQRPSVRALFAAVIFVLGLFVGGIVVGFAVTGPTPPAPKVTITTAAPARAPITEPDGAVTEQAVVSAACLRAINDSQSSYAGMQQLIDAIRSLDAARVDRAIMSLQPLREQAQRDLHACRVVASVPSVHATARPSPAASR
jgi:hypothetical protein